MAEELFVALHRYEAIIDLTLEYNGKLSEEVCQLKKEHDKLMEEYEKDMQDSKKQQTKITESLYQSTMTRTELAKKAEKADGWEKEYRLAVEKNVSLIQERNQFRDKHLICQVTAANLTDEVNKLTTEITKTKADLDKHPKDHAKLIDEGVELAEAYSEMWDEYVNLKRSNAELGEQNKKLTEAYVTVFEMCQLKERDNEKWSKSYTRLSEVLGNKIIKLNLRNDGLVAENAQNALLRRTEIVENKKWDEERLKLADQVTTLGQNFDIERFNFQAKIAKFTEENEKLKKENSTICDQISEEATTQNKRCEALQRDLDLAENCRKTLLAQLNDDGERIENFLDQIATISNACDENYAKVLLLTDQLEEQKAERARDAEKLRAAESAFVQQRDWSHGEIAKLEEKLEEVALAHTRELNEARAEQNVLEKKVIQLKERIEKDQETYTAMESKLKEEFASLTVPQVGEPKGIEKEADELMTIKLEHWFKSYGPDADMWSSQKDIASLSQKHSEKCTELATRLELMFPNRPIGDLTVLPAQEFRQVMCRILHDTMFGM